MATPKRVSKKASKKSTSLAAKAGVTMPAGRIASVLRKGRYAARVSPSSAVYIAAVVDYLLTEMLESASKGVLSKKGGSRRITPRALTLAVRHDADLGELLKDVTLAKGGVVPNVAKALERKAKKSKKAGKKASA